MDRRLLALLAIVVAALVVSGIAPRERLTWFMEVAPVLIVLPLLIATGRRFPLSTLLLVLIGLHALILIVGGHYTYAHVPLGDWAEAWFGWSRNNYDKIGHFAQGFVPAIAVRELLLRTSPLRRGRWLAAIVIFVCLGISALYELIEWSAAITMGGDADAFLGTQGDPWDTQSDMAMALIGAIVAVLGLSGAHDRSLAALDRSPHAEDATPARR